MLQALHHDQPRMQAHTERQSRSSGRRSAVGRRWGRERLPTGSAERCPQGAVLATMGTRLPQPGPTCGTESGVLTVSVRADDTQSDAWLWPRTWKDYWWEQRRW